jgi:2-polyprenyl-6-methoxyphenol hydroxylase-like FAD-dependent oxidoreductase
MSTAHTTTNPSVLIIGAGLGGLTLAQSLRQAGIAVELFERDKGPFDRPQGYRLHLDTDAINAAAEVLSPQMHEVFKATSHWTQPYTTILGKDLSVVKRLPSHEEQGIEVWPSSADASIHANVDRGTLRQILLAGLEDVIHYDKKFVRYESSADGVVAHFSDGSSYSGLVLVGADGIRSPVRNQRAPGHDAVDAGITAIYGRIPIEAARAIAPSEVLDDIFTIAMDERKVFLALGAVQFGTNPLKAVSKFAPDAPMTDQKDYVVCIIGGRHEFFPDQVRGASGAELQRVALNTIASWPDQTLSLLRSGVAPDFFLVEMFTSAPFELDSPNNVTLLGDAIHAMTPTLGRGANLAMRDGALLGRALKQAFSGTTSIAGALAEYERHMVEFGFSVVREAAATGQQRMGQNPLP